MSLESWPELRRCPTPTSSPRWTQSSLRKENQKDAGCSLQVDYDKEDKCNSRKLISLDTSLYCTSLPRSKFRTRKLGALHALRGYLRCLGVLVCKLMHACMQEASYKTHDTCIGKHCKIWMMWIGTKHNNIAPGRVSLSPITLTLWSILSWKDSMDCRGSLDWHFPALGSSNPQFNSETNVGRQISLTLLWFAPSPSIPNISQLCLCCKKISRKWVQGVLMNQYISETPRRLRDSTLNTLPINLLQQGSIRSIRNVPAMIAGQDCSVLMFLNMILLQLLCWSLKNQSSLHFFERSAIQDSEHCGNATSMYSIHVCVSLISVPLTLFWWVFAFASSEKSTYINIFCKTLAHNTCTLPLWKFVFYSFHKFKQTSSFTPASFHLDVGAISEFLPQIKVFNQR